MFQPYIKLFSNPQILTTLKMLYYSSYVLVPVGLIIMLWEDWLTYKRTQFFAKQTYLLLEIKLPKEVFKSPKASEFFINGLYQTIGEKNWYEKYWKGQTRSWFSLEIVSIDGNIHFFVWTKKGHKNAIEANLYSQFPGIEIFEVSDYVLPVSYNPEINELWASEFELTKPDAYPIKTYIDYGMDKDPKEEYKIDPLTPLVEFLGSLGKEQQIWIQILVRAHKAEDKDKKTGKMVDLKWAKVAEEEIEKIREKVKPEKDDDGKVILGSGRVLSETENETIKALGRSVSKTGFDVGIRALYIAPKDIFNPSNIGGIIGGITNFNSHLNGFKPTRGSEEKYKFFALAWKNRKPKKRHMEKQRMLDAYKRRAYFYNQYKVPHFVLNSEELATIFHFPGSVSTTPGFSRIESRKGEAPSNLPI